MNGLFQSFSNNMKSIRNVQLDLMVNQAKISRKSLRFSVSVKDVICIIMSDMILHYLDESFILLLIKIIPDGSFILLSMKTIHYLEGSFILLSMKTIH